MNRTLSILRPVYALLLIFAFAFLITTVTVALIQGVTMTELIEVAWIATLP